MTMPLKYADIDRLEWFYGPGQNVLGHSSVGAMLERASLYHYDTDGRAHPVLTDEVAAEVTAFETGSTYSIEPGWTPDDQALHLFGRVSRHMQRVGSRAPMAPMVFALVHGDVGAVWATRGGNEGSIGALYVHTLAGGKLVSQLRAQSKLVMSDQLRMLNASQAKDVETRNAISKVRIEAHELYELACVAYYGIEQKTYLEAAE